MDFVYRVLGAVARFNESCSRFRINFIPINWIAAIALGGGFIVCLSYLPDATHYDQKTRVVAIGDMLKDLDNPKTYVTVTGMFDPSVGFSEVETDEDGKSTGTTAYYDLLFDKSTLQGILVKSTKNLPGNAPVSTTLTGLISEPSPDLEDKLKGGGNKFGPITVDGYHVLDIDSAPYNPTRLFVAIAGLGLGLLAMVVTFLNRYIVFRRIGPALTQEALATKNQSNEMHGEDQGPLMPEDIRLSGPMLLEGSGSKRFLEMPAYPGYLGTGELTFFSLIDASNRFLGITTRKRAGYWTLALRDGRIWNVHQGFMYCGFGRRPAIRFSYSELNGHRSDTAILSFATPPDCDTMLRTLALYGKYEAPPEAQPEPSANIPDPGPLPFGQA